MMIFCGIDIGTTNTKAVLIDNENRLLDAVSFPEKQDVFPPKTLWYDHFCKVFDYFSSKNLFIGKKIVCSISSQGGSFVLLDKHFKPVSRPYSWTENAGDSIAKNLTAALGKKQYYHTTGWEPANWLMACKLKELSVKNLIPENTRYIAMVPDFIFSNLIGQFVTDITNAQITGLCDFMEAGWDDKILDWTGIDHAFLPRIINQQSVLFENIQTPWGKISFTTSSHDQYAAMQAAGLENDTDIMIGTGTAWVLNARTTAPVFDDIHFMTHPGKDFFANSFGVIITTGTLFRPIGKEFDRLLTKLNQNYETLAALEKEFSGTPSPEAIDLDCLNPADSLEIVQRYMEGSAATAAFLLEQFLPAQPRKIIMSGGAAVSTFWPQTISDLCETAVEAIDFPQFTAYGAALHARSAYEGEKNAPTFPAGIKTRLFEPVNSSIYRPWYLDHQTPMLKKKMSRQIKIKP